MIENWVASSESLRTTALPGFNWLKRSTIKYDKDFVIGLSVLARGSLQEKLRWVFSLYDINGDGYITKDEMSRIVTSIYDMMGKSMDPPLEESTTRDHVERVFQLHLFIYFTFRVSSILLIRIFKCRERHAFLLFFKSLSADELYETYKVKLDLNKDGVVTMEEFMDSCSQNTFSSRRSISNIKEITVAVIRGREYTIKGWRF
ncbi:UNVERIFIED_CONTAM: Calsenilin [Trichonephila clavipes]